MKTIKVSACFAFIVGIFFLLTWGGHVARSVENKNQCIACHTNAKSLITISKRAKFDKDVRFVSRCTER